MKHFLTELEKSRIIYILPVLLLFIYEQGISLIIYHSRPDPLSLVIIYILDIAFYLFAVYCISDIAFHVKFRVMAIICFFLVCVLSYIPVRCLSGALIGYWNGSGFILSFQKPVTATYAIRGTWLTGFAVISAINQDRTERIKAAGEVEVQRLKAIAEQQRLKNAFLKAQLRPHLIFGTLNFIFHSVQEISESTADVIGRLAELIRYALKEPMADGRVPLDEELEHLENYLQLIRITHGGDLHFLYLLHQQPGKQLAIVPYILITFIENVFRHGDLSDVDDPAKIYLTIKDGLLTLRTINRKTKQARLSSGIGMVNMSQRLESEYNGRHSLVVSETETVYEITLVICL